MSDNLLSISEMVANFNLDDARAKVLAGEKLTPDELRLAIAKLRQGRADAKPQQRARKLKDSEKSIFDED